MTDATVPYDGDGIGDRIFTMRGQKVILDADLAGVYGVATKALNQAVKRNTGKFPADFMFQLNEDETNAIHRLGSQSVTLERRDMRSQSVTASKRNVRFRPYVFTEHGAIMAAKAAFTSHSNLHPAGRRERSDPYPRLLRHHILVLVRSGHPSPRHVDSPCCSCE